MVFSKGRAIKAIINTKGRIGTNRSWGSDLNYNAYCTKAVNKGSILCVYKENKEEQTNKKPKLYLYQLTHTEWKGPLSGTGVTAGLELRGAEGPMPHLKREQILII